VTTPKLSVLIVFYKMSRQAANTLYSFSTQLQRHVHEDDYEIIAVENSSSDVLGEERALAQGRNIRYFYREETLPTPVPALNFAFEQSRAPYIGLVIDGARMVSPGVVEHALLARRLAEHPLVVVPGYHLGEQEHHLNVSAGYDETLEQKLLEDASWKIDGYNLFDIACFSGANAQGILCPYLESNCLFCTRESFEKVGRADERFDLPGGGSVNLYIYNALSQLPESKLIVLAGEGSFHQFHGGVTTVEIADREEVLETHRENLRAVFGGPFHGFHRRPTVLGVLPGQMQRFLRQSAEKARQRYLFCKRQGVEEWALDE
jgi:hypothetical protein